MTMNFYLVEHHLEIKIRIDEIVKAKNILHQSL